MPATASLQSVPFTSLPHAFRRDPAAATFTQASLSRPSAPVQITDRGLRVLLVDDDLANQVYGEAMLENLGFRVALASDGAEAVQRWKTESFDLILMDRHMPVMDGLAAARRIREAELILGTRIRIVALTGCADDDEHEDCIGAGMDAVLQKPFNPNDLLALVPD